MFDLAHPITISGVVTRVEWTNPHAYFYLNVTDKDGKVHEWTVETNSPSFLAHKGWTRTTLTPGEKIICTGAPARNGGYFMHASMIELPTGEQLRS